MEARHAVISASVFLNTYIYVLLYSESRDMTSSEPQFYLVITRFNRTRVKVQLPVVSVNYVEYEQCYGYQNS